MWNYSPDCTNYAVTLPSGLGSGDFFTLAYLELVLMHAASFAKRASWEPSTNTESAFSL